MMQYRAGGNGIVGATRRKKSREESSRAYGKNIRRCGLHHLKTSCPIGIARRGSIAAHDLRKSKLSQSRTFFVAKSWPARATFACAPSPYHARTPPSKNYSDPCSTAGARGLSTVKTIVSGPCFTHIRLDPRSFRHYSLCPINRRRVLICALAYSRRDVGCGFCALHT